MDDLYLPEQGFIADEMMFGDKIFTTKPVEKKVTDAVVSKTQPNEDLLNWTRYHHEDFFNLVDGLKPKHHWRVLSRAKCNLGYFGWKRYRHDIVVGCLNIATYDDYKRNLTHVKIAVPIKDILDIENPAKIEYIYIQNDFNPDRYILHEMTPIEVKETDLMGHDPREIAWQSINFDLDIKAFNGFAYY